VLLAGGVTVVVCVGLTIFSFQTKWDFTRFGGILFCAMIILFLFGFMTIFLRAYFPITRMIYAALGALLFSAFLVYDTQKMMGMYGYGYGAIAESPVIPTYINIMIMINLCAGGNHKYSISPEEYIFASLNLYLDIINIFLYLLQLFGRSD
jgi:FtsH-binding integral membrane protein